jgi:hypothetical protein
MILQKNSDDIHVSSTGFYSFAGAKNHSRTKARRQGIAKRDVFSDER